MHQVCILVKRRRGETLNVTLITCDIQPLTKEAPACISFAGKHYHLLVGLAAIRAYGRKLERLQHHRCCMMKILFEMFPVTRKGQVHIFFSPIIGAVVSHFFMCLSSGMASVNSYLPLERSKKRTGHGRHFLREVRGVLLLLEYRSTSCSITQLLRSERTEIGENTYYHAEQEKVPVRGMRQHTAVRRVKRCG